MGVRSTLTVQHALAAVLVAGMAGFATVHSAALFRSGTERTLATIRSAWFLGLLVVAVVLVYVSLWRPRRW